MNSSLAVTPVNTQAVKMKQTETLTSDEVPNLVVGKRIIMAASGGNFSDMTKSLSVEKRQNIFKK